MLHISPDEQKARLLARLDDPTKHWKYNPGDIDERQHWPAYQEAYEIALERTNTEVAPWHVIPADKKWYRNLAIGHLLLDTLERMDPQWPKADFDVAEEKRRLTEEDPDPVTLPTVTVTRYVTPLREGGSLPGIVEADDLGTYVCKFRGAGQGLRVLVAEVIVAGLAERIGLRTPRQVVLDLGADLARYEADEEVQDLLRASIGLNLGIDFLPGSFGYDGDLAPHADVAARVLWLDAFCANVDRSWRNPNLLLWHDDLWVIDHGAALYFHHAWGSGVTDPERFARQPWDASDHVLRSYRAGVPAADAEISAGSSPRPIWSTSSRRCRTPGSSRCPAPRRPTQLRAAYVAFLAARLATRQWLPVAGAA